MPQVDTVHPEDYSALRTRVQHLKQKHVEAVQQQQAHREVSCPCSLIPGNVDSNLACHTAG